MGKTSRRTIYQQIHAMNPNCVWKPCAMALLKIASPLIRNFKVHTIFEQPIPTDGSIIFAQNHTNFYDSLVHDKALAGHRYWCFASDEPRGSISGLSFEAKGVVWLTRERQENRALAAATLAELLCLGENLSYCPEGTWNLTENRLMLPISRGMAKLAITAARDAKVYIVPVVCDYRYRGNTARVREAHVKVCKAIPVPSSADAAELTEGLEDIFWTERWYQLEAAAKEANPDSGVFCRQSVSREQWCKFTAALRKQYKTDWTREENSVIYTREQRLQMEMGRFIEAEQNTSKLLPSY